MIIYGLVPDSTNEKTFVHAEDNLSMLKRMKKSKQPMLSPFVSQGGKKACDWQPSEIRWFDDHKKKIACCPNPDISYITQGSFILGPETAKLFQPVLKDVAEILPVPFNNEIWYFFNVFNQVNALDKANAHYKIYEDGEVGYLVKPAFFPEKVPHAKLFKIPEKPSQIYYAEHYPDDNPDTFKNILEQNKLFGVKLKISQEY